MRRQQEAQMDQALVEALARRAGLEKALARFPDCVAAAAAQALLPSQGFAAPVDPAAEPWPPMRAPTLPPSAPATGDER